MVMDLTELFLNSYKARRVVSQCYRAQRVVS
jgi:hypothetical protein